MNHNAENFTSLKLLLAKHRKAKFAGKSLRARTIFAQRRPKSPLLLFGTLWPMFEIFRKFYLFTGSCRLLRRLFDYARGSTQKGKKKKIRAEFMTSVSYRPEVINSAEHDI